MAQVVLVMQLVWLTCDVGDSGDVSGASGVVDMLCG